MQDKPRPRLYWFEQNNIPLHGIGVILINPENPTESEILLPARRRPEVDWQSINRILNENFDFKNFIELVSIYYQTGRIRSQDWNH